jgi:hypothetical protein
LQHFKRKGDVMPRRRQLFSTTRSKKIAPGVRVTLTRKGPRMSVKVPGLGSYSTRTGRVSQRPSKKGCGLFALTYFALASISVMLMLNA